VERVEDVGSVGGIEDPMHHGPYPYYRRLGLAWATVKGQSIRSRVNGRPGQDSTAHGEGTTAMCGILRP
jgi:hypothetical protein